MEAVGAADDGSDLAVDALAVTVRVQWPRTPECRRRVCAPYHSTCSSTAFVSSVSLKEHVFGTLRGSPSSLPSARPKGHTAHAHGRFHPNGHPQNCGPASRPADVLATSASYRSFAFTLMAALVHEMRHVRQALPSLTSGQRSLRSRPPPAEPRRRLETAPDIAQRRWSMSASWICPERREGTRR